MKAMYKFYEVVKVIASRPELSEINGKEAAILGMTQNDSGEWSYSVQILESEDGWIVMENELQETGRMMSREDFYSGESVTVKVDPVTGEGSL